MDQTKELTPEMLDTHPRKAELLAAFRDARELAAQGISLRSEGVEGHDRLVKDDQEIMRILGEPSEKYPGKFWMPLGNYRVFETWAEAQPNLT